MVCAYVFCGLFINLLPALVLGFVCRRTTIALVPGSRGSTALYAAHAPRTGSCGSTYLYCMLLRVLRSFCDGCTLPAWVLPLPSHCVSSLLLPGSRLPRRTLPARVYFVRWLRGFTPAFHSHATVYHFGWLRYAHGLRCHLLHCVLTVYVCRVWFDVATSTCLAGWFILPTRLFTVWFTPLRRSVWFAVTVTWLPLRLPGLTFCYHWLPPRFTRFKHSGQRRFGILVNAFLGTFALPRVYLHYSLRLLCGLFWFYIYAPLRFRFVRGSRFLRSRLYVTWFRHGLQLRTFARFIADHVLRFRFLRLNVLFNTVAWFYAFACSRVAVLATLVAACMRVLQLPVVLPPLLACYDTVNSFAFTTFTSAFDLVPLTTCLVLPRARYLATPHHFSLQFTRSVARWFRQPLLVYQTAFGRRWLLRSPLRPGVVPPARFVAHGRCVAPRFGLRFLFCSRLVWTQFCFEHHHWRFVTPSMVPR